MRFSARAALEQEGLVAVLYRILLSALSLSAPATAEPRRADPPEFTEQDKAPFLENAFDALVGERPDYSARTAAPEADRVNAATPSAGVAWSELAEPDVLETEIKRQAARLTQATATAARFKAGAYLEASDALGNLSTLMAITADHTGNPRWRDAAASYRDHFAEGEGLSANDPSFQRARSLANDIGDLVRGGRPSAAEPAAEVDWSQLADRTGLMRRMTVAQEEKLPDLVIDRRTLRRGADDARHEAQVLALLAEAILQPGAYDAESEDYQAPARRLRGAAKDLEWAVEANDPEAAGAALRAINRACADCHADYRG